MGVAAVSLLLCLTIGSHSAPAQERDQPGSPGELETRDAVETVLDLFDTYPLVAIAEGHAMQELSELYEAILRHPGFPEKAGIVAIEFGSGAHQDVIDRYVSGEQVPYGELSLTWRNLVGAGPRAVTQSIPRFFAVVRSINQHLPESQRIRILAGQAPFDFDRDYTPAELFPVVSNRDTFFAQVVTNEVLSRNRKALIIAGGFHLDRTPLPDGVQAPPTLMQLLEQSHPGLAYVLQTHDGFFQDDCNNDIESLFAGAETPRAATVRGTALGALLTEARCEPILPIISPSDVGGGPAGPGGPGNVNAPGASAALSQLSGSRFDVGANPAQDSQPHWADGYLFLGTRDELTLSPLDPMLYLDLAYFEEQRRRFQIMTGFRFDLEWEDLLDSEPRSYAERFFRRPPAPQGLGPIVNAASAEGPVAPGSIATLWGQDLASCTAGADGTPLPLSLCGATVSLNARQAPLLFASPSQINFLVPRSLTAGQPATLSVTRLDRADSIERQLPPDAIRPTAPAVFVVRDETGVNVAAMTHQDGRLCSLASPLRSGEIGIVYANGLGAVDADLEDSEAAPFNPPAALLEPVELYLNGVRQQVSFAGLAPGTVGLYQIFFRFDPGTPIFDTQPNLLRLRAGGVDSPLVAAAVAR